MVQLFAKDQQVDGGKQTTGLQGPRRVQRCSKNRWWGTCCDYVFVCYIPARDRETRRGISAEGGVSKLLRERS